MRIHPLIIVPVAACLWAMPAPSPLGLGGVAMAQSDTADSGPIFGDTITLSSIDGGVSYRVVVIVKDDNDNEVHDVEVQFNEPFEGPSPQENPLLLTRAGDEGEFVYEDLHFDDIPLGLTYSVSATMRNNEGFIVGSPAEFEVVAEDGSNPYPDATLVIDGDYDGDIKVKSGDYVVVTGSVSNDAIVRGGTLVLDGGIIGRDLTVRGGSLVIEAEGGVGRDLRIKGGDADLSEGWVTRDLIARGGQVSLGLVEVERDFIINGDIDLQTGDTTTTVVGRDTDWDFLQARATVNGQLFTGRDVNISSTTSTTVNGTVTAGDDVLLRSDGDGGLIVNGSVEAVGEVGYRVTGDGGITLTGSVDSLDDITLNNGGAGGVSNQDVINAVGKVSVVSEGGPVTLGGQIGAGDDLSLNIGGGNVIFSDNSTISISGESSLNVSGGDIVFSGSSTFSIANNTTGTITGGNFHIMDDASFSVGGDSTILVSGGSILTYDTSSIIVQGDSRLSTRGSDPGDITLGGPISVGGDVVINSGSTLEVNGTVSAGDDILLRSDGNGGLVVNDTISAEGEVGMRGQGGGVVVNGDISATGELSLHYGGLGDDDGGVKIEGAHTLKSQDIVRIRPSGTADVFVGPRAAIQSASDIIIVGKAGEGEGDITIEGSIQANGDVKIGATDVVAFMGTGHGGGDWRMSSAGDGGTTVDGTLSATGDVGLRASGNGGVVINGSVEAGGDIDYSWEGKSPSQINGSLTSAADIKLRGDGNGGLIVNDVINAEGDVSMSLAGGGTLGGSIAGIHGIKISWVAPITLKGTIKWGEGGSTTYEPPVQLCNGGPITYYPDEDKPKVDFWQCL